MEFKKLIATISAMLILWIPTGAFAIAPPVAVWSFDDGTAQTADDTGNGQDGTLYGAPIFSSDVPNELGGGNSLDFNGTSDYVALNMSMQGFKSLPTLTASAWFKTNFSSGGNFSNWSFLDFDRSEYFNFFITPEGRIGFGSTSGTWSTSLHDMYSNKNGLNDGNWHHAAVVYDGTNKLIYIDGILDSTAVNAHGGEALGTVNTRYGFIGDGSEATTFNGTRNSIFYEGSMDEVAFWDIALSALEIEDIASGAPLLTLPVGIDIKPGSSPNSINLCSGGAVPIAILGTNTLDVSDIDTDLLRFADASVKVVGKKDHSLCSYEDSNMDSFTDVVCHFVTADIAAVDGDSSEAMLNGELFDGTKIEGSDSINIVKDTCN